MVWKCTTNNEYTHERCPNGTNVREEDLIAYLSEYFQSLLKDKKKLARRLLDAVAREENEEERESEESLRKKIDRLEKQIDKHMELYAEELIDMDRLIGKLRVLRDEIGELEDRLCTLMAGESGQRDTRQEIGKYIKEIEAVMSLKTISNVDLRKILSGISVNEKREVTIHLHDFCEQ